MASKRNLRNTAGTGGAEPGPVVRSEGGQAERPSLVSTRADVDNAINLQIQNNKISPEWDLDVKALEVVQNPDLEAFLRIMRDQDLEKLFVRVRAYAYPSLVRQFYKSLRIVGPSEKQRCQVFFKEFIEFGAEDIAQATGLSLERPATSILKPAVEFSRQQMVEAWTGKSAGFVPRRLLPAYLQLTHILLTTNVYPWSTHTDVRGPIIDLLWRIHAEEWVSWPRVIFEYFVRFVEMVRWKEDLNIRRADLKLPCLITALLEMWNVKTLEREVKEAVSPNVYSLDTWKDYKKRVEARAKPQEVKKKGKEGKSESGEDRPAQKKKKPVKKEILRAKSGEEKTRSTPNREKGIVLVERPAEADVEPVARRVVSRSRTNREKRKEIRSGKQKVIEHSLESKYEDSDVREVELYEAASASRVGGEEEEEDREANQERRMMIA